MVTVKPDIAEVWGWLGDVPDPEIPVVSVVDIGIVRDVALKDGRITVSITPTYSGCPATSVIAKDIDRHLRRRGLEDFEIRQQLSPAWTTDWITPEARERLERYGIAPPSPKGWPEKCPRCASEDLERISQFGSTPCKAQWRCQSCLEPFEYFKCI